MKICSIEDCDEKVRARGWCSTHYQRWRRTGDPLAEVQRRRLDNSEVLAYFHANLMTDTGESCKLWPWARSGAGYGAITIDGRQYWVHVLACEAFNGPKPEGMEVAHGRDRRCESTLCWQGRHLRWDTHKANVADQFRDGTQPLGSTRWNAKLTEDDVREIRALGNDKNMPLEAIARKYAVGSRAISKVLTDKAWRHVDLLDVPTVGAP